MKEWKEQLAQAIVDEWNGGSVIDLPTVGETDRAVKFSAVAKAQGLKHVDRHDIEDIVKKVTKLAPQLRPIRFVRDPKKANPTESVWSTLYFTDLDLAEKEET